jgi:type I restriction-modification system DNA methylase subunit
VLKSNKESTQLSELFWIKEFFRKFLQYRIIISQGVLFRSSSLKFTRKFLLECIMHYGVTINIKDMAD